MIGQLRVVGKYAVSRSGRRGKQSGIATEIGKAEAHAAALTHIAVALARGIRKGARRRDVLFDHR